jgi:phosphoglycolate phosphatase
VIELVVFDLDGTLVDSSRDIASAVNALIEELGGRPLADAVIVEMVGEGAELLVLRALARASLDPETPGALHRFLELYDTRLMVHTCPYSGMVETLDRLEGRIPLSVLTNKPARATALLLQGLGLRHYFGEVIGGDTAWGRKPHPAGLIHLAATAGVAPQRVLMVGDSAIDLATARNAGTRICLVRYGFGYRFAPGDFQGDELFIDSPSGLLNVAFDTSRSKHGK